MKSAVFIRPIWQFGDVFPMPPTHLFGITAGQVGFLMRLMVKPGATMTVFVVLRQEVHEGASIVGIYGNESDAINKVAELEVTAGKWVSYEISTEEVK